MFEANIGIDRSFRTSAIGFDSYSSRQDILFRLGRQQENGLRVRVFLIRCSKPGATRQERIEMKHKWDSLSDHIFDGLFKAQEEAYKEGDDLRLGFIVLGIVVIVGIVFFIVYILPKLATIRIPRATD